jgi:hypothetical protein
MMTMMTKTTTAMITSDEEPLPLGFGPAASVFLSPPKEARDPIPYQAPNPVSDWIRNVARDAGSPEELRRLALTVLDKNARGMLLRMADRWAVNVMAHSVTT